MAYYKIFFESFSIDDYMSDSHIPEQVTNIVAEDEKTAERLFYKEFETLPGQYVRIKEIVKIGQIRP